MEGGRAREDFLLFFFHFAGWLAGGWALQRGVEIFFFSPANMWGQSQGGENCEVRTSATIKRLCLISEAPISRIELTLVAKSRPARKLQTANF